MLKIGFAEEDITPPLGQRIVGHFNDIRVESINDPLYARAMAVEGNMPFIFITCDLLSLRRTTVMEVRQKIEQATGVPGDHVVVSTTHTHTGPSTARIFGLDPDDDYLRFLVERISQTGIRAYRKRVPGTLSVTYGFEGKLNHQRRFMMRNGQVQMHPPKGSTDILYQEGPSDPEYAVIWGEDEGGQALGCWVNYACHVNVTQSGTSVSADYPGFLAAAMKRHQHDDFVTLFANGACGNLCQIDVYDPNQHDSGLQWAEYMGETLADDVLRALPYAVKLADPILDRRAVIVPLPLRHLPSELIAWAKEYLESGDLDNFQERTYAQMTLELEEMQRVEPVIPAEVAAFRLADYAIITLPGEIFVEFGFDLKLKSPAKRTFVVELANGIIGYVPTKRAFEGGGYEQRTATSSKLDPVAGEMLVATGRALLDSMFR